MSTLNENKGDIGAPTARKWRERNLEFSDELTKDKVDQALCSSHSRAALKHTPE